MGLTSWGWSGTGGLNVQYRRAVSGPTDTSHRVQAPFLKSFYTCTLSVMRSDRAHWGGWGGLERTGLIQTAAEVLGTMESRCPVVGLPSGLHESNYWEVCRAPGLRRAGANGSRIGGPSGGQGCPNRAPLWPSLMLRAPTVPSQAGDHDSPWARTLPRGKNPSAQFPARLGRKAQPWPRPRPPQLTLCLGWLLVGGRGWGGSSQVSPGPCWPGTLPSPGSLEVEVTVRAS